MSNVVPNGTASGPNGAPSFVLNARYIWVDCPLEDYQGVRAEVRLNLSQGDRKALIEATQELQDRIDEISERYMAEAAALDAEAADLPEGDAVARQRHLRRQRDVLRGQQRELSAVLAERHPLIAPHIRAWNLVLLDDDGQAQPIPAPAEAGVAAFDAIDPPLVGWLVDELLMAYQGGRKPIGSSTASNASQEPSNAPDARSETASAPATPPSPKRSSGRSASPSKT